MLLKDNIQRLKNGLFMEHHRLDHPFNWPGLLKVPLTPKFFLSCQESPFCSEHIDEKIIVVRFFLDFLWVFKIRKILATVVHGRVTRSVGRVGLWRQPGKPFRLERWSFSSPQPTILLACSRDRELWLGLTPEVRDSRTSHQIWLVENTKRMLCAYSENRVRPELSIPATGQKDRGLWGREWEMMRE